MTAVLLKSNQLADIRRRDSELDPGGGAIGTDEAGSGYGLGTLTEAGPAARGDRQPRTSPPGGAR